MLLPINSPNVMPIAPPMNPVRKLPHKNISVMPFMLEPEIFKMAMSFWRSRTSILVAEETFTAATITINAMINSKSCLVV